MIKDNDKVNQSQDQIERQFLGENSPRHILTNRIKIVLFW